MERESGQPLPLWLVWGAAAAASVFAAFVGLPDGFVVAGLVRPGPATIAERASLFELLVRGAAHPTAWTDDPVRSITMTAGLVAGLVAVCLAVALVMLLIQRGPGSWPVAVTPAHPAYLGAMTGSGVAAFALAGAALVVPVPSRPLSWWFLAASLACATAWLAGRRARAWTPCGLLDMGVAVGIVADAILSRGDSILLAGGWLLLVAALSAAVGSGACVVGALAGRDTGRGRVGVWALAGAGGLALTVIVLSASPAWSDPARVFPKSVRGAPAVVVVAHMDDEAAFAGDTIAWLASHGYRVTVVVATDSRGGRALDKDHAYRRARDSAFAFSLRALGASDSAVFDDVRDGDRVSPATMETEISRDLRASGLIRSGTLLVTVSGTGHRNHTATFRAVRRVAQETDLPLYVVWGYDSGHDLVSRPSTGLATPFDGGPAADASKAEATDRYIALYEDRWPFTLPRAIVLGRGAADVVSVIPASNGRAGIP